MSVFRVLNRNKMEKTANEFKELVSTSGLNEDDKNVVYELADEAVEKSVEVPDTVVYRLAIFIVGGIAGLSLLGILILAGMGAELPSSLETSLATALGALAGMIVPTLTT